MRPEAPDLELPSSNELEVDIPIDTDPTVKLADVITEVRRLIALSDIDLLAEENFKSLSELMKL